MVRVAMLCWRGGGAVLAFLLLIHGLHVDGQDTSTDRLPDNHQLVIIPKSVHSQSLLCILLKIVPVFNPAQYNGNTSSEKMHINPILGTGKLSSLSLVLPLSSSPQPQLKLFLHHPPSHKQNIFFPATCSFTIRVFVHQLFL